MLVLAGIYTVYNATAPGNSLIKIRDFGELNASEGIVMLVLGGFLVALAWLPNVIHRPASPPVLTQKVQDEEYESSKWIPIASGSQIGIPAIQPPAPAWRVVGADEYRTVEDISIWDVPLLSGARAILLGKTVAPISENYIVHTTEIAITLGNQTAIDNFLYSGELPNDPQLRNRFLSIGTEMAVIGPLRVQLSQNPDSIDDVRAHFEVREPIPHRNDGKLDVDAAINQLRKPILKEIESEDSETANDVMRVLQTLQRTDLPITKKLRNSVACLVFKGQNIIESDPLLKLTLGGGLSLWQFITNLSRVIPGVNSSTASDMKWSADNRFASFKMEANINNARVGGRATSVVIAKLFWVTQVDDLFYVVQATRVRCPLVNMEAVHEGLSDILRSYGIGLSKGGGNAPK